MRFALCAMLVIALLAGRAHAESDAPPSSQGDGQGAAPIEHVQGGQFDIGSRVNGMASDAGADSRSAVTGSADANRRNTWKEILDPSLDEARRQLYAAWSLLGARDWIPTLLTLFIGVVAVFAYGLSRTTSSLISVAREQSRDMKEMILVAREAADAAKRSADAAALQARAMVGTELPRFELAHVQLAWSDQSVRQALKAPSVDISFINYGRTTGFVLEKCVEVRLGQTLPTAPDYHFVEALPVVEAVESGDSLGAGAQRRLGDLSESQVEGLLSGVNTIWVYGFVRFRDFLGMEHKTGFCLRWRPPHREASTGGCFVQEDPGAYIYQTDNWPLPAAENERLHATRQHAAPPLAVAAE